MDYKKHYLIYDFSTLNYITTILIFSLSAVLIDSLTLFGFSVWDMGVSAFILIIVILITII